MPRRLVPKPVDHVDPQAELRALFVSIHRHRRALVEAQFVLGLANTELPAVPWQAFEGLRCGAWSRRQGRPCQQRVLLECGRCRLHAGGLRSRNSQR